MNLSNQPITSIIHHPFTHQASQSSIQYSSSIHQLSSQSATYPSFIHNPSIHQSAHSPNVHSSIHYLCIYPPIYPFIHHPSFSHSFSLFSFFLQINYESSGLKARQLANLQCLTFTVVCEAGETPKMHGTCLIVVSSS